MIDAMAQEDRAEKVDASSSTSSTLPDRARTSFPPPSPPRSWLATPAPIRRLFALFPLQTHPPNPLPLSRHDHHQDSSLDSYSSPSKPDRPSLYVFSTPSSARRCEPSFNPSCLKWQAWLRVQGIEVRTVSSNNHASPSGSLPFLICNNVASEKGVAATAAPISAGKIPEWSREVKRKEKSNAKDASAAGQKDQTNKGDEEWEDELSEQAELREQAYITLVEHRIRAAWLYSLYLTSNFDSLACPLYIHSVSSSPLVRASLARSLQAAARTSLHSLCPRTTSCSAPALPSPSSYSSALSSLLPSLSSPFPLSGSSSASSPTPSRIPTPAEKEEATRIYTAAQDAFSALSALLGDDDWFFGARQPGMLDVSLFAYTHLILDEDLGLDDIEGEVEERTRKDEGKSRGWVDLDLKRCLVEEGANLIKHRRRLYKLYF